MGNFYGYMICESYCEGCEDTCESSHVSRRNSEHYVNHQQTIDSIDLQIYDPEDSSSDAEIMETITEEVKCDASKNVSELTLWRE